MVFPNKLKRGSHIRVVAPARSLAFIDPSVRAVAQKRLESHGFSVSFGTHTLETGPMHSGDVSGRVADLHDAFSDESVDAILTVIGGYQSMQVVPQLDYELIKRNPKILCGFSDITILNTAISKQCGLVTYYGPHFSSWGMQHGFDYTEEYFAACCMRSDPFDIVASPEWSDDAWYENQDERTFVPNDGHWVINEGSAKGILIGGHLESFSCLRGTKFFPDLVGKVLFVEETFDTDAANFDKKLRSLLCQEGCEDIGALLIGRFQKQSGVTKELLSELIHTIPSLKEVPVIANLDFGHTSPIATLPIGGRASIEVFENGSRVSIIEH